MTEKDPNCIFCRIAAGEIPSTIVFQNEHLFAFRDLNPQAPVHVLIIPKKHIPSLDALTDADAPLLGELQKAAADIARREGISGDGYRLVVNCGEGAGQTVHHIHYHLLGGRTFGWPPG